MISSNQIMGMMAQQQQAMQALLSNAPGEPLYFQYGGLIDPYGLSMSARTGTYALTGFKSAVDTAAPILSLAGGLGLLGTMGYKLDPFTAAFRGIGRYTGATGLGSYLAAGREAFQAGRFLPFLGNTVAGFLRGYAPYYIAGKTFEHVMGSMIEGAQQYQVMSQFLTHGLDFYNPLARRGYGFTLNQARSIVQTIDQFREAEPDFISREEALNVMAKAIRSDYFRDVTTVRKFRQRFKEMMGTLKEIAEVMNTSIKEAMDYFDSAWRMGYYNKPAMLSNIVNVAGLAGEGLSIKGMMRVQTEGAAMARSAGFKGVHGAELGLRTVVVARDMLRSGFMTSEELAEMTGGLRGEAAYRTLGRKLMMASVRLSKSPLGRALYAALGEIGEGGRYTGRIDRNVLDLFLKGGLTAADIRRLASEKLASYEAKTSFLSAEEDIAGAFAARAGPEGWMGVMEMVREIRGGNLSDDEIKILLKRLANLGHREVEFLLKAWRNREYLNAQRKKRVLHTLRKRLEKAEIAKYYTWGGYTRSLGERAWEAFTKPFVDLGADIAEGLEEFSLRLHEAFFGLPVKVGGISGYAAGYMNRMALGLSDEVDKLAEPYLGSVGVQGELNLTPFFGRKLLGTLKGAITFLGRGEFGEPDYARFSRGYRPYMPLLRARSGEKEATIRLSTGFWSTETIGLSRLQELERLFKKTPAIVGKELFQQAGEAAAAALSTRDLFQLRDKDVSYESRLRILLSKMKANPHAARLLNEMTDRIQQRSPLFRKDRARAELFAADTLARSDPRLRGWLSPESRGLEGDADLLDTAYMEEDLEEMREDLAYDLSRGRPLWSKILVKGAGILAGAWAGFKTGAVVGGMLGKVVGGLAGLAFGGVFGAAGGTAVGAKIGAAIGGVIGGIWGGIKGAMLGGSIGDQFLSLIHGKQYVKEDEVQALLVENSDVAFRILADPAYRRYIVASGNYDPSSVVYRFARQVEEMSDEERKNALKKIGPYAARELKKGFLTVAPRFQRLGELARGSLDKTKIQEIAGEEFTSALFGDRGLVTLMEEATAKGLARGGYRDIEEAEADLARQLAEMDAQKQAKLRRLLSKSEVGRRIIMRSKWMGEKGREKTEDFLLMDEKTFLGKMRKLGVLRGEGADAETQRQMLLELYQKGDVEKLQQLISKRAQQEQKETPRVLLSKIHTSLEDVKEKMSEGGRTGKMILAALVKDDWSKLHKWMEKGEKYAAPNNKK